MGGCPEALRCVYTWGMQLALELFVVLVSSSLAAASLTAALNFVQEREWPAVGFLSLAASTAVTYGMMALAIVRAVYSGR